MATRAKELSDLGNLKLDVTANGIDVVGVGSNFKSESYNILNLQTDTDDSGSSDDGIFKITNGAAGTTKAEFRWDESEDLVHVSYGDHGRHISIGADGKVGIATGSTAPSQTLDVNGTAIAEQYLLDAVAKDISVSASDVFIYDTRKDSDGGAWRGRTQHKSWYNETLNTATRGSRKEFPAVAIIVCEEDKVTIYDGDDPDMPMWMVCTVSSNQFWIRSSAANRHAYALNGIMMVGTNGGAVANSLLSRMDFLRDRVERHFDGGAHQIDSRGIIKRNQALVITENGTQNLISRYVNDVAMTVLTNPPIDDTTGLPVPTIAAATDAGITIIKDDGRTVNIVNNQDSSAFNYIDNLFFRKDGALVWTGDSLANKAAERFVQVLYNIPETNLNQGTVENSSVIDEQYGPSNKSGSEMRWATTAGVKATSDAGENFAVGTAGALHLLKYNRQAEQEGAIAHITSDYNTGYMHGDIKVATLSDTDDTNVTGGTQPDRSYNNNAFNVTGTVTKTAVATDADIVAYSGFSSSNYLEQPYNTDLDFGTGDFSVMGWFRTVATTAEQMFLDRSSGSANIFRARLMSSTSQAQFAVKDNVTWAYTLSNDALDDNSWYFLVGTKIGGSVSLYINGVLQSTASGLTTTISSSTSATLDIGHEGGTNPADNTSLALWRVSGTAPSPEQIIEIYNDEKYLFQDTAKATLYGSSDEVVALENDDDTGLLHAGTSAGRSVFKGLRRVDNTTDAVGAAISASNGMVAED